MFTLCSKSHLVRLRHKSECLSLEWFRSRAEAKAVIETWRRHYNEVRPHSSLGYLTPAAFAARLRGGGLSGDGADRCGMWSLRAPPRRITVPQGAEKGRNRGGRLKLSVVRKNWAGQRRLPSPSEDRGWTDDRVDRFVLRDKSEPIGR
jgi:hypothetical protein